LDEVQRFFSLSLVGYASKETLLIVAENTLPRNS